MVFFVCVCTKPFSLDIQIQFYKNSHQKAKGGRQKKISIFFFKQMSEYWFLMNIYKKNKEKKLMSPKGVEGGLVRAKMSSILSTPFLTVHVHACTDVIQCTVL